MFELLKTFLVSLGDISKRVNFGDKERVDDDGNLWIIAK